MNQSFKLRPSYPIKFIHDKSLGAQREVNLLITMCKSVGIPVYSATTEYDLTYPYIRWDCTDVTQHKVATANTAVNEVLVTSALEFLSHFNEDMSLAPVTIKVNSDYDAILTLTKDGEVTVKVGCQTIPVAAIKEILETIVKLELRK